MRPQRILFLYSSLGVGGAERQLALLAPRLRERGFQPLVATLRLAGRYLDELTALGIPTFHVGMRSRSDLRGALRGYRLWRTRPDVVFTQSIDAHMIGYAVAHRARAPHVVAEHGGAGIRRGLHHVLATRLVAPRVDRAVAVSESQLPDLLRLGYRERTIRVIPNGLPDLRPIRSRGDVRRELGLGDDEVVAALVATLRPEKRADRFIDAVTRAHARESRVRGLLVGGGPQLEAMRARAEAGGDAVLVLGERSDVADLMTAADAVCLSSDVEGLPMTALEAMALARPVISTDVGGLHDAVLPGRTGWLVSRSTDALAAALLELAGDLPHGRAMGEEARSLFRERYTVERMADAYVALFREVAGAGRRTGPPVAGFRGDPHG